MKGHSAIHFVAALLLGSIVAAEETTTNGLDPSPKLLATLVSDLDRWLDDRCTYVHPDDEGPAIGFIDAGTEIMVGNELCKITEDTRGFYDPERLKVFLVRPWDPADTFDVSVLLHELIHYRQEQYDWRCVAEMERPAYRLQEEWLTEQGVEYDFNWLVIYRLSRCPGANPHP